MVSRLHRRCASLRSRTSRLCPVAKIGPSIKYYTAETAKFGAIASAASHRRQSTSRHRKADTRKFFGCALACEKRVGRKINHRSTSLCAGYFRRLRWLRTYALSRHAMFRFCYVTGASGPI